MPKPTRSVLALTAASLVLGLVGAGVAVADESPLAAAPAPAPQSVSDHGFGPDAQGKVVSHAPLAIRSRPSTHAYLLGTVHPHHKVGIVCKKRGEPVAGNDLWYRLDDQYLDLRDAASADYYERAWVSARYVKNLTPVRWCR